MQIKIGFHIGPGGNATGLGDYLRKLDAVGLPFVVKAADVMPIEAQQIAKNSSVPHVVIYRRSVPYAGAAPIGSPDVPDYNLPPAEAALKHWEWHKAGLPPELDKDIVWIETINEVDKNRSEWLAQFALETAKLTLADGYKWAAFGWSAGEPEPEQWRWAKMAEFLRLCANYPARLAVALHEYSLAVDNLLAGDGWLVGRFQKLHEACQLLGIAPPTILITEFGWTYNDLPPVDVAMAQLKEAAALYAPHENVKGAALWYLGAGFGGIANKCQPLIAPVTDWIVAEGEPPTQPAPSPSPSPCRGAPRADYRREVWVLPQSATADEFAEIARQAYANRNTVGFSYDDAGIGDLSQKTAVLFGIAPEEQQMYRDWYAAYYPGTAVEFRPMPGAASAAFAPRFRPCQTERITQYFGDNPQNYAVFGLPGHDGLDYAVPADGEFYAVADGVVVHASDRRWSSDTASAYGWHVVIDHVTHCTVYAHARPDLPVSVGDVVRAGDVVGYSGNTGNSTGYHLHFGVLDKSGEAGVWPVWRYGQPINPLPFVSGLPAPSVGAPTAYQYSGQPVTFRAALHGPADDWAWQLPELRTMLDRVGLPLKYLSHGINPDYFDATADWHMVRVFWRPDRHKTPAECWQDVGGDILRMYGRGARRFELFNEPNLPAEGLGVVWDDGAAFGAWLREFVGIMRSQCPGAALYYPGLSPGVPWTNQFAFTNEAWPLVADALDGFCLHAYTGETGDVETAVSDIVQQVREAQSYLKLAVPLVVSEASVNRPAAPAFRVVVYHEVERRLAELPGVEAVVWFVSQWSPEMDTNGEAWLDNGVGESY